MTKICLLKTFCNFVAFDELREINRNQVMATATVPVETLGQKKKKIQKKNCQVIFLGNVQSKIKRKKLNLI